MILTANYKPKHSTSKSSIKRRSSTETFPQIQIDHSITLTETLLGSKESATGYTSNS